MSLNERRFSLKMMIFVFVMLDIFVCAYMEPIYLMYFIGYQISLVLGFLLGLRGQGRYKEIMLNLSYIARNKKLTPDEREHRLVMGIHHAMLELGYIYEERNINYGFKFAKKNDNNIKKTKKIRGVKIKMDSEYWKRIGYTLATLWALWGLPLLDIVLALELKPLWVIFIVGGWETLDGLIWWLLKFYFGVEKEEVKEAQPPIVFNNAPATWTQPIVAESGTTSDTTVGEVYFNGTKET